MWHVGHIVYPHAIQSLSLKTMTGGKWIDFSSVWHRMTEHKQALTWIRAREATLCSRDLKIEVQDGAGVTLVWLTRGPSLWQAGYSGYWGFLQCVFVCVRVIKWAHKPSLTWGHVICLEYNAEFDILVTAGQTNDLTLWLVDGVTPVSLS